MRSTTPRTTRCSEKVLAYRELKRKHPLVAWTLFSARMRCVLRGTGLRAGLLLQMVSRGGTWTVTSSRAAGVSSVGCGQWSVASGRASCGSQRGGKWSETPRRRQTGRARGRRMRGQCALSFGLGRCGYLRGCGRRGGWKEKDPVWEGRPAPPGRHRVRSGHRLGWVPPPGAGEGAQGGEPRGAGPGIGEPGGLQSMGLRRVRPD